jgi:hypothetical protein
MVEPSRRSVELQRDAAGNHRRRPLVRLLGIRGDFPLITSAAVGREGHQPRPEGQRVSGVGEASAGSSCELRIHEHELRAEWLGRGVVTR